MAGIALTPSTRQVFEADLVAFETGKGTVRLQYGEPVPSDLLRRMIVVLVVEHERDGVLWMRDVQAGPKRRRL